MKKILAVSLLLVTVLIAGTSQLAYAAPAPVAPPGGIIKIPIAAPSDLGLKRPTLPTPTTVVLQWTDNSTNETGFQLQIKKQETSIWVTVADLPADATFYSVTGLEAGTTYHFRIRAVGLLGSSAYSEVATITTASLLTIRSPNGGEILTAGDTHRIEWNIIGDDHTNREGEDVNAIISLLDDGEWTTIAAVPASQGYYVWLVPNIHLENTRIKVAYLGRYSMVRDYSDATFTINSVNGGLTPVPPTHLKARSSASGIVVAWDHSNKRVGFRVERKVNDGDWGDWEQIGTISEHTCYYTDRDVSDGHYYMYRVRATKGIFVSDYTGTFTIIKLLNAPTSLNARLFNLNNVELTWIDNSDNEEGYQIIGAAEGTIILRDDIVTVDANVTSYTFTGLNSNTSYNFKVRAVNSLTHSDDVTTTVTTSRFIDIWSLRPVGPSNLEATAVSDSVIDLRWTDESRNELGFKIERKTDGEAYAEIAVLEPDINEFSDCGLSQETAYCYRVRAYNDAGDSDYSNEANAVTQSVSVVGADDSVEPAPDPDMDGTGEPASEEEADDPVEPDTGIEETVIKLYIDNMTYYVDGELHEMDTTPTIRESRTFLPIRFVAEPIGAEMGWDGVEKKVTITLGDKVINLWIDNNTSQVGEDYVLIDSSNPNVKPFVLSARTMLPIRFITEQLGCAVDWNSETREVKITYPAP